MNTRYFSRDGGPPFAVTADDIPDELDELDGCDEVSAADMDAAEQAHRQALAAFAQAEAERVNALDVDRTDIGAALTDAGIDPEITARLVARLV